MRTFENEPLGTISSEVTEQSVNRSTTRVRSPIGAVKLHECAATLKCCTCKKIQPLENFSKGAFNCKPCMKVYLKGYRERNRAKLNAGKIEWYYANRERLLLEKKEYTRLVSRTVIKRRREQRQSDPTKLALHNYKMASRRTVEKRATPAWADRSKIVEMYLLAQLRTKETGVKHSVDHKYPLQGKFVCGLHVAENLQVIPFIENCSKYNTFKIEDIV